MKQRVAILVGAGALALSSLVWAQAATTQPAGGMDFPTLDSDGDGSLSEPEFDANAEVRGRFSTVDGDRDGRVSPAEMSIFMRNNAGIGTPRSGVNAPLNTTPQTGRDSGVVNRGVSESSGVTSSGQGGIGPGGAGSGASPDSPATPGDRTRR